MNPRIAEVVVGLVALTSAATGPLQAGIILVPNGSFESPKTAFVDLNVDSWQKSPKPEWYIEDGVFLWSQLTGTFKNTPVGNFDHIDNCDGDQAIWMFAIPEAGIFQDYNSMDADDSVPKHEFDAKFEVGKGYKLVVGCIAGGGGMSNGVTAEIRLYYRDAASNRVTVAAASITNTPTIFSNRTHLVDFEVSIPNVKAGDAWVDHNIGIQFASTVNFELQGGYWDFDNVRLSAFEEPTVSLSYAVEGSNLQVSWTSSLGEQYQVQSAENLHSWTDAGPRMIGTGGTLSQLVSTAEHAATFVRLIINPSP